jgi:DNA polymerase III subunit delta
LSTLVPVADVDLKPVYLLTGNDRPKVEHALERLKRHFTAESVERVFATEASGADVVAHCNAGSLFGDRRLVVVNEVDGRRKDGRLSGGWKAADIEQIVSYLAEPAPTSVLALVAEEMKADAALAKTVTKRGQVLRFDVSKKQGHLEKWVIDRFRSANVRAEPEAAKALLRIAGDDLYVLASEIDKIATWAAGEPVGEREVEALAAAAGDTPIYQVTDAWGRRDRAGLARQVEAFIDRSERSVAATIPIVAAGLARQVGTVRKAARLAEQGVAPKDAMSALGVRFEFQARNVFEFARNYGARDLDLALTRLADLDHALKGGSRLLPAVELQRAVGDIARPPGKHGAT